MSGFDFTSETREKTTSHIRSNTDEGRYRNFLGLCKAFGGAEYQNAVDEATDYANKCRELGAPFVSKNPLTQRESFFYLET